jgi:D-lactate dehydrogenase
VYEQESEFFYEDLSNEIIQDDVLQRLMTFPNVLITSHQAYFTDTALRNIAETTIANMNDFAAGRSSANEVKCPRSGGEK